MPHRGDPNTSKYQAAVFAQQAGHADPQEPAFHRIQEIAMKKSLIAGAVSLLACAYALPAGAADSLVKFEGGIGVHPLAGVANGVVLVNTVRGVPPGGRPWAIQKLKANIRQDGSISAKGQGLVLGGSDAIGTRGGVLQVSATLFCGATAFTSAAADLSVGGDFEIRGPLNAVPPAPCTSPALLIRNATGGVLGNWFAAGTLDDD
jgi:hypothetical protein